MGYKESNQTNKQNIGKQCKTRSDAAYYSAECGIWSSNALFAYKIYF